ncbi:hypothetical protein NO263_03295 [Gluconacetobacter entanii]|uniref:PASTA domain-containing protein n=2 Tax=Acetobacteraceae TaxID=433 RepID=A0ABQ0SFW3_NOVHA|nr:MULTISPECIES: hypothetical protein [Acetobacteraceae]MCW4589600.1 hypothetical protein [Gluconacetobacter entanii]MCW4593026.1 hypothetical protein [Gluconacetobacter entanii]NPC89194.1 hypothetical protein [Gluconacetobacter entanii]GAN83836.1 hypothetical protein Gaha_0105_071 [Novacetimonas hansenii JCM 7643]GEC64146.1 hypothetical protein GHA01_19950 [Novacetimonas hansenii]
MTQNDNPADNFFAEVRTRLKHDEELEVPSSSYRHEAVTPQVGHLSIPVNIIPLQGGYDKKRLDQLCHDLGFVPDQLSKDKIKNSDDGRKVTITRYCKSVRKDYLAGAEMTLSVTFNIADNPFSRG